MWNRICHHRSFAGAVGASLCALNSQSRRDSLLVENSDRSASKPVGDSQLRFGVITDIQYADIPMKGVPERDYRGSLKEAANAIHFFNSSKQPLDFITHLGDIVDDYNSTVDDGATTLKSLTAVMKILSELQSPNIIKDPCVKFLTGNHEMYNFSREHLASGVETEFGVFRCADMEGSTYYSWSPVPKWRIIVLDPYIESVHSGGRGSGLNEQWLKLVCERNPNIQAKMERDGEDARRRGTIQCDYFKGMDGEDRRFCPFNGGLGEKQLLWLRNQLRRASSSGERVILFSHILFHPEASRAPAGIDTFCKTIIWDFDKVLEILCAPEGRSVVACLHGHQHEGGFHTDEHGIHHIVFESPLFGPSYAIAEFDTTSLTLRGSPMNRLPSKVFPGGELSAECWRTLQLRTMTE